MSILFTADWQTTYENFGECTQAWEEVLSYCKQYAVDSIVIAGDLKTAYNPLDVGVIKWWFKAIKQARDNGLEVLCNLGNHDRSGLYVATDNWFPILRKAGAKCFDRPTVYGNLAFLPFRNSIKTLREDARELASQVGDKAILIFHGEVAGAKYNQFGTKAENGINADWLYASRYRYCIGGHFHLQQKINENIYYCGSPFAQDWGEANQEKGYIITDGVSIQFVRSSIPGWYDPTWPNFRPPVSWKGTKVRVHIELESSVEYVQQVARTRLEAQRRYQGAEIFVSTTFRARRDKAEVRIKITDPDQVKIREFIRQTCPENIEPAKLETYLCNKIEEQTGRWQRTGTGVTFLKAEATNFLSFSEVNVDWNDKGIVVVQGTNKDRRGKSNGSGKTSLLQTIPVALFGSTFKGQKHDRWAKRGCEETAQVTLELRDAKNRTIKISRTRKPSKLRLWVDGKEQSTGMNPNDKEGTQGLIEKLTGFTWQTLANAVYIDQQVAYEFIAGTKKSRTDVLSKIQNLERFEKALKVVRADKAKAEEWARQVDESISVLQERIEGCKRKLDMLVEESESRVAAAWKELEAKREAKERNDALVKPMLTKLRAELESAEAAYESYREKVQNDEWVLNQWKVKRDLLKKQRPAIDAAQGVTGVFAFSECPTCRQAVSKKYLDVVNKKIDKELKKLEGMLKTCKDTYQISMEGMYEAEGKYDQVQLKLNKVLDSVKQAELTLTECDRSYRELKRREHNESGAVDAVKQELKATKAQKKSLDRHQTMHRADLLFYQYCEKALSRDGIPAFLNALLCEPLNAAAEYYSELFSDKALQVRFELENGEFVPTVLNATGGESIEDQSEGERALAGMIASFSLRETTPKCNLLILDEPGNGLDPSAARQFAKGLRELLTKFESIWLTTHNSAIASELVDQKTINVIKQNGVSVVG